MNIRNEKLILLIILSILFAGCVNTKQSGQITMESESMNPHIRVGDNIFVDNQSQIITYETGKKTSYKSFDDFGDVIIYKPFGKENKFVIHRAMYYVEKGETMWADGPPAPNAGYITKGDNSRTNPSFDQQGGISYNQPVKKEWIIGVARQNERKS